MCDVPLLMPACCPQGNVGVYWVFKDDDRPSGLGEGWTGFDEFHGWGMTCDGPGFFQVQFCPWCGRELGEPYLNKAEKRISRAEAIEVGEQYYLSEVARRLKDMADLE